jgi:predicted ATPase
MLRSFIVRNFRLFDELRIENLGSVNLIVGKNNSGKSCLLEALHIYASDANPKTLVDMAVARDEHWLSQVKKQEGQPLPDSENFLRYLFHGYGFPEIGKTGIELGPISPEHDRIQIVNRAYQLVDNQDGRRLRVPVDQGSLFDDIVNLQLALEIKKADKSEYLLPLSVDPTSGVDYRRQMIFRVREPRFSVQTVPTGSVNENLLAQLWDNVNLTDLQDEVVACLRLIDASIKDVAFVGEGRSRIAIIRKQGSQERLPLKNMGDGILRLFHIILAVVNVKDGLLLIDEFENGLYWGVQPQLWKTLFRISEKLNVQVFATTHSKDCVSAFRDAWAVNEDRGSFHRIDSLPNKGIKCVPYTHENLADAIDMYVEVR